MTGFVMVPGWLLERGVSPMGLLTYAHLAAFGTWNPGTARYDECRPAMATLVAKTGLSENSIRKALKELLELGALEPGSKRYDPKGGQLPTVYRVIFGELVPPGGTTRCTPGMHADTPPGVPADAPNQEVLTKNQTPEPSSADAPNINQLLGAWLDWLKARGVERLHQQTKARYGKEIKAAVASGFAPEQIGAALQAIYRQQKVSQPALLPHILTDLQMGVSDPTSSKSYVEQAHDFKARKAQADQVFKGKVDELLEAGVPLKEAMAAVEEAKRAFLAQEPVASSTPMPYIEGVLLAEEPKEVTGS